MGEEFKDNIDYDKKLELKKSLQSRLRRIEGQVKGIEKMIENDVSCRDILIQVAAIRAAINKVGGMVLENYAKKCIVGEQANEVNDAELDELLSTLLMFLK